MTVRRRSAISFTASNPTQRLRKATGSSSSSRLLGATSRPCGLSTNERIASCSPWLRASAVAANWPRRSRWTCFTTSGNGPREYDPSHDSVVGWIMIQARSRAIDRLRFEQRRKRLSRSTPDLCRRTSSDRRAPGCPRGTAATLPAAKGVDRAHARRAPYHRDRILLGADVFGNRRSPRPAAGIREDARPLRAGQAPQGARPRRRRIMTSPSKAGCEGTDRVAEYALRALPASEYSAFEAHVEQCRECRLELEALRPIVAAFVDWPTDVLRPPTPLWGPPRAAHRHQPQSRIFAGRRARLAQRTRVERGRSRHLLQVAGDRQGKGARQHAGAAGARGRPTRRTATPASKSCICSRASCGSTIGSCFLATTTGLSLARRTIASGARPAARVCS